MIKGQILFLFGFGLYGSGSARLRARPDGFVEEVPGPDQSENFYFNRDFRNGSPAL